MDDFGMFARDLGYRPSGKAAPMKSSSGSDAADRDPNQSPSFSGDDQNRDGLLFNDVFGGPPKYFSSTINSSKTSGVSDFDLDSIFKNSAGGGNEPQSKSTYSSSTLPVYDKPVYDDDIFDGLPGMKSKSMSYSSARYEDNVFASMVSPPKRSQRSDHFDDLLGNLGKAEKVERKSSFNSKSQAGLDDLLPGFGSGSPAATNSSTFEPSQIPKRSSVTMEASSNVMEDPFVVLESTSIPGVSSPGLFTDPLEEISKLSSKPGSVKAGGSSPSGGVFDDLDPLNGFGKSVPGFSNENNRSKDRSPLKEGPTTDRMQNSTYKELFEKTPSRFSESHPQKKVPVDDFSNSHKSSFDMPSVSIDSRRSFDQTASPLSYANYNETASQVDTSPRSEDHVQPSDDIWLTVAEIPLVTQPTRAPPPLRPPPPIPRHTSRSERGSFASNSRRKGSDNSSSPNSVQYSQSPRPFPPRVSSPVSSQVDDLENFAMGGRMHNNVEESVDIVGEETDSNSAAAAAMKEAMDRAEAKFRHAKEVREREHAKATRNKETPHLERDEESQDGEVRENQERLEEERRQREREKEQERERERRRVEKERAMEIEREKARQAVERATREARERAAIEARERAASEARLKAERAAVQRAQAEARERAAVGARERAERAAIEARERAAAEARERVAAETREKEAREKAAVARTEADARRRAERAAVERVAAEARERAAAEARERAAARMNQQKNDNDDLESFFSTNSRPSSAPRPRATSSNPASDPQSQNRGGGEGPRKTSSGGVPSNMRKASSTTNIVDDLSSIFGAAASTGGFQDVEGETDERRRARLERHQRTQDRAAKALAEKNQRDLQTLREQEERHRMADTLDSEIKRWSAGKEGNLRALLSTLQYVLWPECGWQPVSLTDLITGASVKKVYRKATLCIHPDKVQQKGANLQQKYIAEKVFDLLKEAWNKFNSEELF